MKQLSLCLLMALFTSITVKAQEFHFGAKAGLNYAFVSGSDVTDTDPTFKYHAGLLFNYTFAKTLSIQPELLYSVKGYGGDKDELDLSYVDIPILLKVKFLDIFSVHAGPQFGYLLAADSKFDGETSDVKDNFKDFDLGAAIGAEYEMPLGLSFGLRYTFSITSIGEDYKDVTTVTTPGGGVQTITTNVEAPDAKNGVIQLFAAFQF